MCPTRVLFIAAFLLGRVAAAQTVGSGMKGNLQGTVADASGAMVPQASVIALGEQGNREITYSNDSGDWSFPNIPAGRYTLQASKRGFEAYRKEGVELDSGSDVRVEVQLVVGPVLQTVDVAASRAHPVPATTPASAPRRVKVGGNLQAAKLIKSAKPVYPEAARQLDVEGIVLLQAVIGTNGSLLALQPMNQLANPDLVASAMEAVRQWQYSPTLLNGVPVEVQTTITINFRLE
jgi:TonB family protein